MKLDIKNVDGDGLRENKDGSKLQINFAARTRDAANESLVQQYLLWWKEIGLDVQLYTGRTIESNNSTKKFNRMIQKSMYSQLDGVLVMIQTQRTYSVKLLSSTSLVM